MSPRNSREGTASLIKQTECRALLHGANIEAFLQNFESATPMTPMHQIPSFDNLCQLGCEEGVYAGHYDDAGTTPVMILHTSGSTGNPKSIKITNGAVAASRYFADLAIEDGRQTGPGLLFGTPKPVAGGSTHLLVPIPFFHVMGMMMMVRSVLCKEPLLALPPQRIPNAQLVIFVLEQKRPWGVLLPPSLLEDISNSPRGMNALAKLAYAFYGGAPLAKDVAERITKHTTLVASIGSTECGAIASFETDQTYFNYWEWSPKAGVVMEPQMDGLYEMVIKRVKGSKVQAIFYNFPELDEWRTKDLYEQHPKNPSMWMYKCRKDDVLVLNNGEKFNPISFEKTMENEPLVKSALLIGAGRFQTGLLIELDWDLVRDDMHPDDLIDQLWPTIERANSESPSHGRVWRSKVAIARKDRPFLRAPKGSVVRRTTCELYQREIDALYSNEANAEQLGRLEEGTDLNSIKQYLRRAMKLSGLNMPQDAADDADFFSFGVDSLQVLALSSNLSNSNALQKTTPITARSIYAHPSINSLASYLQSGDQMKSDKTPTMRQAAMEAIVRSCTREFYLPIQSPTLWTVERAYTVILTGSTGSLGNYLLQELIAAPAVSRIFCFDRSEDAAARQQRAFIARGAEANFKKVTFLQTDLSQENFGIPQDTFATLLKCVNIIIHNAWAVDFNKTVQSYEHTHIAGVRRLIDFSLASECRAKIVFISSIASVGNWTANHPVDEHVPERVVLGDHSLPLPQGYGESKHVAECILGIAAQKSGVPVTIVRAGQLAGPSDGRSEWNRHEWVPSLVLSSMAMGMLPDRLGNLDEVDWVPIDWAAKSVWEVATAKNTMGATVAHVVNPKKISWSALVPTIRSTVGREEKMKIVSYEEWIGELRKVSLDNEEVERMPAVKLLEFYEGLSSKESKMPTLATVETEKMSDTMREMTAVDDGMVRKWVEMWCRHSYAS
jgi:thioester reductase-like protein